MNLGITHPDEILFSLVGLLVLAVVYLAIAVSALRAQISELKGRLNGRRR